MRANLMASPFVWKVDRPTHDFFVRRSKSTLRRELH